jgi:RimJ/RimL family protein N-acetyltransferase
MPFENIITPRLMLRPLQGGDAVVMFRYRSDPLVSRYQLWQPANFREVEDFIQRMSAIEPDTPGKWYQLAICAQNSGAMIGDCGLHFIASRAQEVEFGITLAPEHQAHGYAFEALKELLCYLFNGLGKHRVYGWADARNQASIRLMKRVGMHEEARLRESFWSKGEWVDEVIYALLDWEWENTRKR